MIVSASTDCFPQLDLVDAIHRLGDLEYTATVITVHESGNQIKPSEVASNLENAIHVCRDSHRLDIAAYSLEIAATGEEHYRQFEACCRLAKATKVVSLSIPSAELGTPFNEEVEHLRRLVKLATIEGILVSIRSQIGRLSEDADTAVVLCDNVKGLGVALDPSHYICGPKSNRGYDQLYNYVHQVNLRDTSDTELQVRVGQGKVEYSRIITNLQRVKYKRALNVSMVDLDQEGIDHHSEMRKIRLLLESLI